MVSQTTTDISTNKSSDNAGSTQRELDLSQADDLQLFLDSVEDIHNEAHEFHSIAEKDKFKKLDVDDISGEEIFQILDEKYKMLQETATDCRDNFLLKSIEIPNKCVDEMQSSYNDMLSLSDHIVDTYEAEYVSTEKSKIEPILEDKKEETVLPAEADVILLMKKVFENQFLVESERNKALELYESFNRSVASSESTTESLSLFSKLETLIREFEENPKSEVIIERANRILDHVYATHEISGEVLQTATDLFEEVKDVELSSPQDSTALLNAYRELETFARNHEAEWLSVCGVRIPKSGPEGIKQARKLREVLMTCRDTHPSLRARPEKQVLVDKLVRRLSQIPEGGLDKETTIPELIQIAHTIDVPDARAAVSVKKESEQKPEEGNTEVPRLRRKTMQIVNEDKEVSLKISVAEKAEKEIEAVQPKEINNVLINKDLVSPEVSVVARTEAHDPINTVIADKIPESDIIQHARDKNSLTNAFLRNRDYLSFIEKSYGSAVAFDKVLNATISQIEADSLGVFERWLGEDHVSPFSFLKNMTVEEIYELTNDKNVRKILIQENIKYEMFLTWIDIMPDMLEVTGAGADVTFAELYARWMVESGMKSE